MSRSHPRSTVRRSIAVLTISSLIAVSAILAAEVGQPGTSSTQGVISPAASSSTPVGFSIVGLNLSGFSIGIAFTATLGLSGGPVSAGESLNATASLSAPPTVNLTVGYKGTSVPVPVNPLGSLYELPIPGLEYGYEGIASLGLYLNFSGTILGNTSLDGPAAGGGAALSWNNSATDDIPLSVWSNASDGSTVQWSVTNLSYGLSIGIDASGSLLGYTVTIPLVSFGSVGLFAGSPSSASASYTLPAKSGSGGGLGSGPGLSSTDAAYVGLGILALLVIAVLAIALFFRHRKRGTPPTPPPPP